MSFRGWAGKRKWRRKRPALLIAFWRLKSLTQQVVPGDFAEGAREQLGRNRRVNSVPSPAHSSCSLLLSQLFQVPLGQRRQQVPVVVWPGPVRHGASTCSPGCP